MRKLTKLTFIFVAIICIALSGKAYAASLDCNIEIQTSKTEYAKGEEFTANVCVSGIKSEKGILALSAILDYDKDSLNLIQMTGKNTWDTPAKDVSYNESTGKMVLLRDSLGKDNEVIFEMKFQVNKNSDANALITLNEVTVANGIDDSKEVAIVQKNLTITNATTPPPSSDDKPDNNPGSNPPSSGNTGDNNQGGGSSSSGDNNNQGGGNNNSGNNNSGSTNNGGSGSSNSGSSNNGSGSNNSNKKPSSSGSSLAESLGTVTTTGTPTGTDSTSSTDNNTSTTGEINIVDKASGRIPKTGIGEVSYTPIYIGLLIILIIAIIYCVINMKLVDREDARI